MQFQVNSENEVTFRKIHPLVAELIRNLPFIVDPNHLSDAAEGRLYPDPSTDPDDEEMRADWRAFVSPDIQAHFQSARDTVASDLRRLRLPEDEQLLEVTIPTQHVDAWLNVLNQARLALAADATFDESVLEENDGEADLLSEEGVTTFRIHLYAAMQESLVEFLRVRILPQISQIFAEKFKPRSSAALSAPPLACNSQPEASSDRRNLQGPGLPYPPHSLCGI